MTDDKREGAPGAETSDIAAAGAPGRERRMTARRKQEAVLRVLRGESLETVARELRVTAADLSGWRDAFLEGGAASLKSRPRDDRDARISQLQAKLGEITMDKELLEEKIARMEGGHPLGRRRL
jgi:transposase